MATTNRYIKHAHVSEADFRRILRCFCEDLTASQTASITGLHRNTINRIYGRIRQRIARLCEEASPFSGSVEVDESYFGARRVRGRRGRGAFGKTIVFGIFKRNGKVYTEVVPNCQKATLQRVIRGRVRPSSLILSDGWRGYNGLVEMGYGHCRIRHDLDEFVRGPNHINGIEAFWSFAKRRLAKFNGLARQTFYLHLKECEFRFNHRDADLCRLLLKQARKMKF